MVCHRPSRSISLLYLIGTLCLLSAQAYNRPDCPSWPSPSVFDNDLGSNIDGLLHGPIMDATTTYAAQCETLGTNAYAISSAANGLCMHAHACAYQFCQADTNTFDLPRYTVEPASEQDLSTILQFANTHNLPVSIKSTGHSYVGSSTAANSLLIWMQNYPKDGAVVDFTDSCGTTHTVIGVGGGSTWNDIIESVGDKYHVVTGGGRTVSAVGGWLQGSGLSFTSRQYGLGVDQVLEFTVVLANGDIVTADACTNTDLFWALRGGGGGTYGVVTHAHYKVYPVTPIVQVSWGLLGTEYLVENALFDDLFAFLNLWLSFWLKVSPQLESRWAGGFFGAGSCYLTFTGSLEEAKETFLNDFDAWYDQVLLPNTTMIPGVWGAFRPSDTASVSESWYDVKGGKDAYNNPALTDPTGDAYDGIETALGARLMPLEVVLEKPEAVQELIFDLAVNEQLSELNYYLGGNVDKVAVNETSVHPALRKAIYSLFPLGTEAQEKLRQFIPNNVTGVCYNHHNVLEPDWRQACFGDNYQRLLQIKETVDPDHRFNCWHCVGYQGKEIPSVGMYVEPDCPAPVPTQEPLPTQAPVPTPTSISASPVTFPWKSSASLLAAAAATSAVLSGSL